MSVMSNSGNKLWGYGKVWVVHLRRNALERLDKQINSSPGADIWVELDYDWRIPITIDSAQSPLYIDPIGFSDDPTFASSVLESWYSPMGF